MAVRTVNRFRVMMLPTEAIHATASANHFDGRGGVFLSNAGETILLVSVEENSMGNPDGARQRVEAFLAEDSRATNAETYLDQLIELHETCASQGEEAAAARLRETFLLTLDDTPEVTQEPRYCQFLANQVSPSDFAKLRWQSPERVIRFCEILYGFQFPDDTTAESVRLHVAMLLRESLQEFERRGSYEQMLQLVQMAPTSPALLTGELLRLRNRVHMYEMNRVRRNKRILHGYLVIQAILVVVVFPLLFVYAENGEIRDAIKVATDVSIPEKHGRQHLQYSDGLYWSLITAASIGYGDVTPRSNEGRAIAAVLGTMGVLTIGVLAGLILNWITPRRLD